MKITKKSSVLRVVSAAVLAATCVAGPSVQAGPEPYIGEISMFGGNFAPRGWALTDGQLLPISQYTALFSILGTTYGGDGRTTFALPDLRGRVPMHAGSGPGLTPRRLGEKGGVEQVTLTLNQIPSHTHAASSVATTSAQLKATAAAGDSNVPTGNVLADDGTDRIYKNIAPDVDMSAEAITATTSVTTTVQAAGGGQAHTNIQPYQVINFIIALEGIFPPRN